MRGQLGNREIAAVFATIADMLEIKGESIHRVLAYRRAAETIASLQGDIRDIYAAGELTTLPNIGKTLADKIDELLTTGRLAFFEHLADEIPLGVIEMLRVPSVGPKRAARFWRELGITNLAELQSAAEAGRLRQLPGIGASSEGKILQGIIELAQQSTAPTPLDEVSPIARQRSPGQRNADHE